MSKRLAVLKAVKALVEATLPGATVRGLDSGAAAPERVGANGQVIVRAGDPGDPAIDLCPPVYHYDHVIPLDITAYQSATVEDEDALDQMMGLIGAAVAADRTLGGRCDYLEATAPLTDDVVTEGAATAGTASLTIVASYSTTDPLN